MATPKNNSVLKAFKILRAFKQPSEWATGAELSRRAGLPEASGHRLVHTLESIGVLVRDSRGRYRLGMLLRDLGHQVIHTDSLREAALPSLRNLSAQFDVTSHMAVMHDGLIRYIARVDGKTPGPVATKPDDLVAAHCTALGKALLAELPPEELREQLTPANLISLTPQTIVQPQAMMAELENIRRRGYACNNGEFVDDVRCISIPVRDGDGRAVAAISVSDRAARLNDDRKKEICDALKIQAAAISRKLYPGQTLN